MKKGAVVLGCLLALQLTFMQSSLAQPRSHSSVGVSFNVFYDGLGSYGDWISVGGGVYGWRPLGVAVGWRPYTVGRWCWTDDGWYWASDEPWGWAAYHYGRWTYDEYYGWIWIPGYDWAPAWVEWRYGGDYVGWAPLSPYAVFSVSWGIHYRTRWYTPVHWWNFVGCGYIASHSVHRYVYRNDNNTRYIGITRTGGSVRHEGGRIRTRGPEREYIERRGNVRVEPVRIREVEDRQVERIVRDGNREQIEVYRPRIQDRSADADVERPARVRESSGRTLDLDTRKIDVRSREVEREEGRDVKRAEEVRTRDQIGRGDERNREIEQRRDNGMLRGPVDDAIRNREGRTRERVEQPQRTDDARNADRSRERVNEGRSREQQPAPQREPRERRREESVQPARQRESIEAGGRPQREEFRSPAPERRMEMPRSDSPRSSGSGGRSEGGRSGRGR